MAVTCYRGLTGPRAFILARARDSSWLNAKHYIARSEPIYRELILSLSTPQDTKRLEIFIIRNLNIMYLINKIKRFLNLEFLL